MASVRNRGNRFTGLYRDAQGNQKSAGTFDDEDTAFDAAQYLEILAHPPASVAAHPGEKHGNVTVAGYAPGWLSEHAVEETTRYTYESALKHIIDHLGDVALIELDAEKIRKFFRKIEKRLAASTAGNIRAVLSEMCKTAVSEKKMGSNPVPGVKAGSAWSEREIAVVTKEKAGEIQQLMRPEFQLLVETLFATGARWSELMGLGTEHVEIRAHDAVLKLGRRVIVEQGNGIHIRGYGKSKWAKRDVTVPRDLGLRLKAAASPDGWIFRAVRGGVIRRTSFYRRVWKPVVAKAGVPGFRIHDARHTHISWLANDPRVPLAAVRYRAGHSSLSVTSRYIHVIPGDADPCLISLQAA